MAIVRDIITHVEVEVAVRVRICHRNRSEHSISSGQSCLVIFEHDGGRKNYCPICAKEILSKAKVKLIQMESAFQT